MELSQTQLLCKIAQIAKSENPDALEQIAELTRLYLTGNIQFEMVNRDPNFSDTKQDLISASNFEYFKGVTVKSVVGDIREPHNGTIDIIFTNDESVCFLQHKENIIIWVNGRVTFHGKQKEFDDKYNQGDNSVVSSILAAYCHGLQILGYKY